jgi:hypothetical protein
LSAVVALVTSIEFSVASPFQAQPPSAFHERRIARD